jgi:hypothetical protein
MLLPQNWTKLKRKRTAHVERDSGDECSETIDICVIRDAIEQNLQLSAEVQEPESTGQLNWLISKISVLKMLAGLPEPGSYSVPIVTRAYEESFMRECKDKTEKPCIFQTQCECMKIDRDNQFVGVQFALPCVQTSNGMCILCLRKSTHLIFYNVLREGHRVKHVIQKYGNICNVPGEYHSSAMLICPPHGPVHSMPLPIVAHQRNRYSVVTHFGIRYMKQHNVYMEDFQHTPSPPL